MSRPIASWVVRHAVFVRNDRQVTSWWSGPEQSWGYTFGPLYDERTQTLCLSVAVFSTRREAREAMAAIGLRGCTPVRLSVALDGEYSSWRRAS